MNRPCVCRRRHCTDRYQCIHTSLQTCAILTHHFIHEPPRHIVATNRPLGQRVYGHVLHLRAVIRVREGVRPVIEARATYLCVCVCVCVCACVGVCRRARARTHTHTHTHLKTHAHTHTHTYTHTHRERCMNRACVYRLTYTNAFMQTCTIAYARTPWHALQHASHTSQRGLQQSPSGILAACHQGREQSV